MFWVYRVPIAAHAALLLGIALCGCGGSPQPEETVASTRPLTFEQWKETVRVKQFRQLDVFAVGNKVVPRGIMGETSARQYFEQHVSPAGALILHNGQYFPGDPIVPSTYSARAVLRYCIDRVGLRDVVARHSYLPPGTDLYPILDIAFGQAAAAWNEVAQVSIRHESNRDETCRPTEGDEINWYVTPYAYDGGGLEYLAFVLHPLRLLYGDPSTPADDFSPENRLFLFLEDILVEFSYPDPMPFGEWFSLEGLFLHTIGQGLGFIDESNRGHRDTTYWPSSCQQPDAGGIYMTIPDPYSVTTQPHAIDGLAFPQCAGARQFDYAITYLDAMGAACQYRDAHQYYYCNPLPQRAIQAGIGSHCSPVPVASAGDCGAPLAWDQPAAAYHAAVDAAAH